MALSPTLTYTSEAVNGAAYTGILTDSTTYGSPNADRADVGVYITGNKLKQDGSVDYAITIASFDPDTATTFSFDILKDGHHQFTFVVADDWTAGTYNANDLVFYSDGNFYQTPSSTSSTPGTAPWALVSDPTSLIGASNQPNNITYQIKGEIVYPFAKTAFGDATEDAALECCSDCDRGEDVKTYEALGVLVDGMNVANQRQKYSKGERMSRKAAELAATL